MLTIGSPGGKAETPPPEMEQKRQRGSKLKSPNPQRWFNSTGGNLDIVLDHWDVVWWDVVGG